MDDNRIDKAAAFDTLFTNNRIQILKTLAYYIDPHLLKGLAVYIKLSELQYTLALDRQNDKLDRFFDPHHPAILRMIRMVIENAHREGIFVGICGELAADEALTEAFLRLGVDELSVAPSRILPLREKIRSLTLG